METSSENIMKKEHILFLRNRPHDFNLGDFLCTPMHYVDFNVHEHQSRFFLKSKAYKTILGGGAFNDLGISQKSPNHSTIAWGVGSSVHGLKSVPTNADNLPFLLYGVRDIDATLDADKVLPCVTCLHPLVQIQAGHETGLFLNYDRKITSRDFFDKRAIEKKYQVNIYTNYLDEWSFMKAFEKHGKIITNSFHIAYWSLISGREVAIIGYSSKFRSLLRLLNLDPSKIHHYDVKSQDKLMDAISHIMESDSFISSPNFKFNRERFIESNIDFAQKCVDIGFASSFAIKSHGYPRMLQRKLNYQILQTGASVIHTLKSSIPFSEPNY